MLGLMGRFVMKISSLEWLRSEDGSCYLNRFKSFFTLFAMFNLFLHCVLFKWINELT